MNNEVGIINGNTNCEKPLFFLFTCVKEGRPFISKLFESLLRQTAKNFIHFIYDDGSNDPIEDLVVEYKNKVITSNHPFEIIYEKNNRNLGLNLATNYCINRCSCPYFIWIDCDNWVDDHFFEELEKQVLKRPNDIVVRTNTILIDANSSEIVKKNRSIKRIDKSPILELVFRRFKYSFFAVNYNMLKTGCRDIKMLDDKRFFNDKQILFISSHIKGLFSYNPKALGYALIRTDSEYLSKKQDNSDFQFDKLLHQCGIKPLYNYKELEEAKSYSDQSYKCYCKKQYKKAIELIHKKRALLKKNGVPYKFLYLGGSDFKRIIFYKFLLLTRKDHSV